jgi:DNA-binding GntR family transcriptional regulator
LAAQGLVIKKQGKGTFVAEKSADHMVGPLISSSEVFLLNNYNIKTTVIKAKKKWFPAKEYASSCNCRTPVRMKSIIWSVCVMPMKPRLLIFNIQLRFIRVGY